VCKDAAIGSSILIRLDAAFMCDVINIVAEFLGNGLALHTYIYVLLPGSRVTSPFTRSELWCGRGWGMHPDLG
jgi:hypothetical protein